MAKMTKSLSTLQLQLTKIGARSAQAQSEFELDLV